MFFFFVQVNGTSFGLYKDKLFPSLSSVHLSLAPARTQNRSRLGASTPRLRAPIPCARRGTMDGHDGDGQQQRRKPHGNPYPKRGAIKEGIFRDLFGKKDSSGHDGDNGNGNGGGGGDAGGAAPAAGCHGDY